MEALHGTCSEGTETKVDVYASLAIPRFSSSPGWKDDLGPGRGSGAIQGKGDLIVISVFARAENCAIAHDEKSWGIQFAGCYCCLQAPYHATCSLARRSFRGLCDLAMMMMMLLLLALPGYFRSDVCLLVEAVMNMLLTVRLWSAPRVATRSPSRSTFSWGRLASAASGSHGSPGAACALAAVQLYDRSMMVFLSMSGRLYQIHRSRWGYSKVGMVKTADRGILAFK